MSGFLDDFEEGFSTIVDLHRTIDVYSHGDYKRYKQGCKCRLCSAANVRFRAARLKSLRPEEHGTMTAYMVGCRCEPCKGRMRAYDAARSSRKRAVTHK